MTHNVVNGPFDRHIFECERHIWFCEKRRITSIFMWIITICAALQRPNNGRKSFTICRFIFYCENVVFCYPHKCVCIEWYIWFTTIPCSSVSIFHTNFLWISIWIVGCGAFPIFNRFFRVFTRARTQDILFAIGMISFFFNWNAHSKRPKPNWIGQIQAGK